MTAGVYAIVNRVTARRYIGSSKNIEQRWSGHHSLFRCRRHVAALQRDWEAYGSEAFVLDVLEEVDADGPALVLAERKWIDRFRAENPTCLYNQRRRTFRPDGGEGGSWPELKALRLALEMTQEAFARHLGVSISTVRDWEQDRRHPRGLYRKLLERELARARKAREQP